MEYRASIPGFFEPCGSQVSTTSLRAERSFFRLLPGLGGQSLYPIAIRISEAAQLHKSAGDDPFGVF
jgi:hypothetical protein